MRQLLVKKREEGIRIIDQLDVARLTAEKGDNCVAKTFAQNSQFSYVLSQSRSKYGGDVPVFLDEIPNSRQVSDGLLA